MGKASQPWIVDTEAVVTRNNDGDTTLCQWWNDGCHGRAVYVVSNVATDTIPLVIAETCELHVGRALRDILGPDI
jgi:hypothetical protein